MIMQNTFSLIIATYGRYKEIDRLLHSFAQQEWAGKIVKELDKHIRQRRGRASERA